MWLLSATHTSCQVTVTFFSILVHQ
ncbi:hypothetical protein F383_24797 [Gossypium arboreum]|uniref:Uncharacterized protein n=1 Tax=Gossypium arboreum TaxID=29729 RepID=A0A0B0MTR2_GOSAR|nr:hypothetical protein F383_24797 [Gossypium arboreum]